MNLKSLMNMVAIGTVAFGSLAPMASTAEARDGYRGHGGSSYRGWDGPRTNRWGDVERHHGWRHGNRYARHHGYRRHRDNSGAAIAAGTFAIILGLALAAESRRVEDDYYRD